ncbi:MAG: DUF3786 domain-containing protein [Candidatus Abyssobacteria bacterium SURF_5]|uniref:DUF3786 domain-containing protein n=1 Tax=Abyssobacteria bacterium (strain SURF_5) TaxID=2093360 RepID=A0A3A4NRY7_ABYX5|nr:MAG: DUF3786 domain-containing protein [Candidatus Abyssubacteria bacterium SURF_5]
MSDDGKMKRPPQNTYEDARKVAWEVLEKKDPAAIAADGLLEHDGASGLLYIPFLSDRYAVDLSARKVMFENGLEVYPFLSVLLLHYLMGVNERPLAGEWITFRQFEGGDAYFGSFTDRTLVPLKNAFGQKPDLLEQAARPLGAERLDFGDVGLRVPVFPKLPLAVVLWTADSEFPPEVNVLFDKTANTILRTEDLAICGALTVSKLRKNAEKLLKTP